MALKKAELDKLMENAEKSMKCDVFRGSDEKGKTSVLPTGIDTLDHILKGGLRRGRIHIFSGEFSTGKTYITQKLIENTQKNGGLCVFVDAERRYDPDWFKLTGVNIDELVVAQPLTGEQAVDMMIYWSKNSADVVVVDSFAALLPMAEYEADTEQQFMGLQARLLAKAFRKIVPVCKNTAIVGTNQLRYEIGGFSKPGIRKKLSGGISQYYFASLIMSVRRREWKTDDKTGLRVGFMMECFLDKCNFGPPFTSCEIPFNFYTGQLDLVSTLVSLAIDENIVVKEGSWYSYQDIKIQGKENLEKELVKQDKLNALRKEITDNG